MGPRKFSSPKRRQASVAISAVNIAGGFLVPRRDPMFLRSAFQNGYEWPFGSWSIVDLKMISFGVPKTKGCKEVVKAKIQYFSVSSDHSSPPWHFSSQKACFCLNWPFSAKASFVCLCVLVTYFSPLMFLLFRQWPRILVLSYMTYMYNQSVTAITAISSFSDFSWKTISPKTMRFQVLQWSNCLLPLHTDRKNPWFNSGTSGHQAHVGLVPKAWGGEQNFPPSTGGPWGVPCWFSS